MLNKFVWMCMGFCLAGSLVFMSCANKLPPATSPTAGIIQAQKDIGTASTSLQGTTEKIKVEATQGMKDTPPTAKPILDPHWTSILTQVGTQNQIVTQLQSTQKDLGTTQVYAIKLEKERDDALEAKRKAEESVTKELRKKYLAYSGWLFFGALVSGGVAFGLKGNKIAVGIAALCAVGCVVCIFLVQTVALIPYIMIGIAVIVLAMLIYSYIHNHGQISLFKTAAKELVTTVENAKPLMSVEGRKKIFGDGAINGGAHSIQSEKTQDVVDMFRKDIEKAPALPGTVAHDFSGTVSGAATTTQATATVSQGFPNAGSTEAPTNIFQIQAPVDSAGSVSPMAASSQNIKRRAGSRKIAGPAYDRPERQVRSVQILFS